MSDQKVGGVMIEQNRLSCACKPSAELAAYLFWKLQARLLKQQNRLLKLQKRLKTAQ